MDDFNFISALQFAAQGGYKLTWSLRTKMTHVNRWKKDGALGTQMAGRTQRSGRYCCQLTKTSVTLVTSA